MPFRVQCPHADCKKFMLLEDDVRGTTVPCLVCTRPIKVDVSASDSKLPGSQPTGQPSAGSKSNIGVQKPAQPPPPSTIQKAPAPPPPKPAQVPRPPAPPQPAAPQPAATTAAPTIVHCPNPACNTALRLTPATAGQAIRCPKCKQVFKP